VSLTELLTMAELLRSLALSLMASLLFIGSTGRAGGAGSGAGGDDDGGAGGVTNSVGIVGNSVFGSIFCGVAIGEEAVLVLKVLFMVAVGRAGVIACGDGAPSSGALSMLVIAAISLLLSTTGPWTPSGSD
jgi:hypothetical protein